jgi:hypothetical protein
LIDFIPDGLILPPDFFESFKILDLRVVGKSLPFKTLPTEGVIFSNSPTMTIGDWFAVEVENRSDISDKCVYGAVVGTKL